MSLEHYAFAKLIHPVTPEQFFAEYWEKKELIVHRNNPSYYRDLLNYDVVDEVVGSIEHAHNDQHNDIIMGNFNDQVSQKDYTFPSGLIDVARLYKKFNEGSSIALNHLHDRVPALANLCRSLEAELSIRFQTNIYFTPPDAQCFPPHYDSHCVFAMQCEGAKNWRLYDFPVTLPHHNQKFDPKEIPIGPVSKTFTLQSGDFIYCPRGLGHDADTKGLKESSLHITLGVLQHTWTNLILEAIAQLSLRDPELRKALPIGFARPGFDRTASRAAYQKLVDYMTKKMDFETAMDFFVDDIIATRHPVLPGQLRQIQSLRDLNTVDRRAGRRPNLLYRIKEQPADGNVKLQAYGGEVTLPKHTLKPLVYALEHDDYQIKALPGDLDDAGKLVLIRRLVLEGLVMLK